MKYKTIKSMLLIAISLFILSAFIPYNIVDPLLYPYEQEFLGTVKQHCNESQYLHPIQKTIHFAEVDNPNNIANCATNNFTKLNITYNITYWNSQGPSQRFSTMTHELTHCYFNTGHNPDPSHYMYYLENYLPRETVQKQLEEFLKERCK